MSYISNNTRVSRVIIANKDYTSSFIEMTVSDTSANRQGCVQTSGVITLGSVIAEEPSSDYFRDRFKRGDRVNVFITTPGGGEVIHPRGLLYVISTTYDVESEVLSVEVACELSLIALTENNDPARLNKLLSLVPIGLDTVQRTYSNCCAGIASSGQYVYQSNTGALERRYFWAGDNTSGTAAGEWVSVLGVTTNSVAPLSGGGAIPDEISLSYQVPDDGDNDDNRGRIDIVTTDSYYFLQYPATTYQRQNDDADPNNPNGTLDNITGTISIPPGVIQGSGSCGNNPSPPAEVDFNVPEQEQLCNDGYTLVQSPVYVPATGKDVRLTYYSAPGGQVSRSTVMIYGPRLEANNQYFADNFAFCRQTYATGCNFSGGCPYSGMDRILLSETETINSYGSANELRRSIQDTYVTRLSAAQPSDWRSGNVNGEIQNFSFRFLTDSSTFRKTRVDNEYYQEGETNVQKTTTYESATSRGSGLGGNIDALAGIKTSSIRRSTTIVTLDVQPDIVNSPTTSTEERKARIPLFTGRYTVPPTAAGPYILEESMPQPVLLDNEFTIRAMVADYSNYLVRFTKGEAFGLQLGEGLRQEVVNGYYPGMPFRYYDPQKGILLAMRMDATSWGVSNVESAFVTSGLWNGVSNGSVTIPENILGNSTPDMDASNGGISNPTPPPVVVPPSVDGEDNVDSGTFAWYVDVNISFSAEAFTYTEDGIQRIPPEPQDVFAKWTTTVYVDGLIVETGGLLATNGDGSIPLDYNGSLVTNTGVFVAALFD